MARVRGILTSKGGLASHAAVVARGWGIPAVVGADEIRVGQGQIEVGDRRLEQGSTITINGQTGEVFRGKIEIEATVTPEADVLLGWARELDIDVSDGLTQGSEARTAPDSETGDAEVPDEDTVVRALHIKGFATPEALGPAVLSSEGGVRPALAELESKGLVKKIGEMYQLTEQGKSLGESLIGEDRDRWSLERANEALDGFLPLDQRVKVIVTSWQMREVDGEQVINDHSDEEYDEQVISELASVHRDAVAWLEPHTDGLPRLTAYVERLEKAMARVEEGDYDHVASPRIDSYHNVWFELHEDLILLAGRTREEETEAGRA
jgi:pyruvate,orthophosphate dikinase